jgi:hypothetical protein
MSSIRESSLELIKQLSDYCGLDVEEVISAYKNTVGKYDSKDVEDILDYTMYLCLAHQEDITSSNHFYEMLSTKNIHHLPHCPSWVSTEDIGKTSGVYLGVYMMWSDPIIMHLTYQ